MNKRQKKKKLSVKKQLRIEKMKYEGLFYAHDRLKELIVKQNKIIRRLGSDEALDFLEYAEAKEVEAETIKAIQWGDYVCITDDMTDEIIEGCEKELALGLVRGMMKENLIQFIVKEKSLSYDPLNWCGTVAAKIRAIPWYDLAKKKE